MKKDKFKKKKKERKEITPQHSTYFSKYTKSKINKYLLKQGREKCIFPREEQGITYNFSLENMKTRRE